MWLILFLVMMLVVMMVILFFLLLFFFLLLLLRLTVNLFENVINWLCRRLRLNPFLIGVVIDPREPRSSFADIFDDDEIVTVCIGPLDPVFESRVFEL